jgi:hypothetical protein
VFSPAVVSTAFENLQVNGIVLHRSVLLYLEGLVLLTGSPGLPYNARKEPFGRFLLMAANSPREHRVTALLIEGAEPARPLSLVQSRVRSKRWC